MNLYQYCGNNPVNWVDPWGLWGIGIGFAGAGGEVVGGTVGGQLVVDNQGNIGIYIHSGGGPYLGASGGGFVEISGFSDTIDKLKGTSVATGGTAIIGPGAGVALGLEGNNGTAFGGNGGVTVSLGGGGGTPEGHSFIEEGVVVPLNEVLPTPQEVANYWRKTGKSVAKSIYGYFFGK
jgi:hypothetical protein